MKMNVIREYVHLAKSKNFTRTAEELYIAQSALSRHIAGLESELGVKLINRDHNHFSLTPAGQTTLEEFQKILVTYQDLLDKLSEQDKETEGTLNLGFLYYDRDFYVSTICKRFHEMSPKVQVLLHSGQPQQLDEPLFSGEYDAIFYYGTDKTGRTDIQTFPFLKIPYYIICNVDHRFATMDAISPSDFVGETLLIPGQPLSLQGPNDAIESIFGEIGEQACYTIPIKNFDEVPLMMAETDAIYLSPMANPKAYGPDTVSRDFMPEKYSCNVSLVWMKGNENPTIPLLCKAIRSCFP
ncbi:MAG: LysR family transcriptional regulator [Coriobacteriales bacterium]